MKGISTVMPPQALSHTPQIQLAAHPSEDSKKEEVVWLRFFPTGEKVRRPIFGS